MSWYWNERKKSEVLDLLEKIVGPENVEENLNKIRRCFDIKDFLNQQLEILNNDKFSCSKIGEGSEGKVYKCQLKCDLNFRLAVKKVKGDCSKNKQEIEILQKFDDPRILKIYGTYKNSTHCFILTNLIEGINLEEYKDSVGLNETKVKMIIKELLEILKVLHDKDIIHRDIKSENVLLSEDNKIYLIDFGHAVDLQNGMGVGLAGTLDFISPEMLLQQEYGKDIDIWEVGVLTYELLYGIVPFYDQKISETLEKIKRIEYTFLNDNISREAQDFIKSILVDAPSRPNVDKLLEHPWLN